MTRRCLIVYGSLMHPEMGSEISADPPQPVWVLGFRRGYFQTPMWRKSESSGRFAVLSVQPDQASWMNAVLWTQIGPEALQQLDVRERGYVRTRISRDSVQPFDAEVPNGIGSGPPKIEARGTTAELVSAESALTVEIYVGRRELYEPSLRPLPEYVAYCRDAAAAFGDEFLEAFDATTRFR